MPTTQEILDVYEQTHSYRKTANVLDMDRRGVARRVRRALGEGTPSNHDGYRRHIVIPDVQAKDGVPLDHLEWAGRYIADMQPDVVVCLGDFADLPSLSAYDKGKKTFEGRRYKKDVEASKDAMRRLMAPINAMHKKPELHLTLGNHEERILRAIENEAILDGVISIDDLGYEQAGWNVYPYLHPVEIDGVNYAHYFVSGVMSRPVASARALVAKNHVTCVQGHVQKCDLHRETRVDGKAVWGVFASCFYQHDEDYLGAQNRAYWRGIWVFNEVNDGDIQPMMVSLDYLKRRYEV
jgi:hypothetical protein